MTGDVLFSEVFNAAENNLAPGSVTIHLLALGANTTDIPVVTGFATKGATIIPPSDNTATIVLKGVTGDTGVAISKTDPTSIAFDTGLANFVLTAGAIINGLRIVWS
jgi:hypothetical protein